MSCPALEISIKYTPLYRQVLVVFLLEKFFNNIINITNKHKYSMRMTKKLLMSF